MIAPRLPVIGDTLAAKYVLRDAIGAGGMGVVFVAEQPSLERRVAIKVLSPALAGDPVAARRFSAEARAASMIAHAHVAAILDVGETDEGLPFFVMEYVRGPSLARVLAEEGVLDPARACALVRQILACLDDVHAAGLVHGDVKSDNVLVETARDQREHVKLIDFGLARIARSPVGELGVVAGTPEYLAPELVRGGPTTAASDVYATTVILYELVTGETPFSGGTSAEILARQVDEPVVPPSLRRADGTLTPAFDLVVLRGLAKDPSARFASAAQLAHALAETHALVVTPPADPARDAALRAELTELPTERWDVGAPPFVPRAVRSKRRTCAERATAARAHLAGALAHGDSGALVDDYLELSRALVSCGRTADAIHELEEGTLLLGGDHAPPALWKLWIALASLYETDHAHRDARRAASCAFRYAADARSELGTRRATSLVDRLVRAR
ncbi:MAG TPA: serine/threonine-protein kinase [Kofleriaceae bacterium]|nr:serine/threonine-protein kinase [Kofleriaceae bacterium]